MAVTKDEVAEKIKSFKLEGLEIAMNIMRENKSPANVQQIEALKTSLAMYQALKD